MYNFIYDCTGLFHADPHRGNLLREKSGNLAFIDFGMMADVTEEERYGLVGLAIALQNKDLPLITENLLNVRFFYCYLPIVRTYIISTVISLQTSANHTTARIPRRYNSAG